VHGYSVPKYSPKQEFTDALAWATKFNKELWVGEYAAINPSREQALVDAGQMLTWMRSQPRIGRVAWFNTRTLGTEPWTTNTRCLNMTVGCLPTLAG